MWCIEMRNISQKCIRLTDAERQAQEQDMKHYKNKLLHTPGGGELSDKCAYDFNRGWEYALGRFRYCGQCPRAEVELCWDRNH